MVSIISFAATPFSDAESFFFLLTNCLNCFFATGRLGLGRLYLTGLRVLSKRRQATRHQRETGCLLVPPIVYALGLILFLGNISLILCPSLPAPDIHSLLGVQSCCIVAHSVEPSCIYLIQGFFPAFLFFLSFFSTKQHHLLIEKLVCPVWPASSASPPLFTFH